MPKLAVCQRDWSKTIAVANQIRRCLNTEENYEIYPFHNGTELLAAASQMDLCVLDTVLPDMDGIEVGQRLLPLQPTPPYLYITEDPNRALEAYRVWALQYLVRPFDESVLRLTLHRAMCLLSRRSEESFSFKTNDGLFCIPMARLRTLQPERHVVHITLCDGSCYTTTNLRVSFSAFVEPLLQTGRFVRPHHSYVVNLHCIRVWTRDHLTLNDGDTIPVSHRYSPQIMAVAQRYLPTSP